MFVSRVYLSGFACVGLVAFGVWIDLGIFWVFGLNILV